jgi:hypothetical protein
MQVDDEICFYYRFGPFEVDYHPAFLARYGATPPTDWPAPGGPPSALKGALQWQRFKAQQLAVFLGEMAGALRAGGADVPITHEQELQLAPPANFAALAGAVDVLHPEFYLDPGAYTVPTIELCAAAIRAAQRGRREVIAAEMSAGDILVRHLLTGEGISGFLGFTYTTGIDASEVSDMSTFDRTLLSAGARLAEAERVADTAIVWPSEYLYAPYDSTRYGFQRDVRGAIERDIPALALLLIRAGLAFDLLDTDVAQPADYERYPTVWLACADVLPQSAQRALVRYVRRGGHLICWPAPPTLDENYEPCTLLGDTLYPEPRASFYPEDFQTVHVLGTDTLVYRGVQTFTLRAGAREVARRGEEACGYTRPWGRGRATLLGTWPAADAVAGRIGDALEVQDLPAGERESTVLAALAKVWPAALLHQVNPDPPPQAGSPTKLIVFDYTNERRGGEVITGGTAAYWDGENVAPIAEINLGTTAPLLGSSQPEITRPPFRPILPAHRALVQRLHRQAPACQVSDPRIQGRLLRARHGSAATVSLVNRYDEDIEVNVLARLGPKRHVRLDRVALPAGQGLLLPIAYELEGELVLERATVQLVAARAAHRRAQLTVTSFGGGELALRLPGRLIGVSLDGRPAAAPAHRSRVLVRVPAGGHEIALSWRGA